MDVVNRSLLLTKYKTIRDLPKWLVVTLACYKLGGAKKKIHSEDIMNQAFLWNKTDYSWSLKKYSKYPDNEGLRKSIFMARTNSLIVGAYARNLSKDGWYLTEQGIEKSKEYEHLLDQTYNKSNPQPIDKKELTIIKKSKYFKDYSKTYILDDNFDIYMLGDLFHASPQNEINLRYKFFNLLNISSMTDEIIYKFLDDIKNKFPLILDEEKFLNQLKVRSRSASSMKEGKI